MLLLLYGLIIKLPWFFRANLWTPAERLSCWSAEAVSSPIQEGEEEADPKEEPSVETKVPGASDASDATGSGSGLDFDKA